MLTIWTNKIKHSTAGSSFSVTFSVAPNELEYLNKLYDCFSSMNWSSFPITADRKTENCSEKPNNCEPQTYVINPQEPTNDDKCFECDDFFTCGGQCNKIEDEPQTCEDCKHNGEKHAYDYACDKCTDMDKFQHEDEPQTERSE